MFLLRTTLAASALCACTATALAQPALGPVLIVPARTAGGDGAALEGLATEVASVLDHEQVSVLDAAKARLMFRERVSREPRPGLDERSIEGLRDLRENIRAATAQGRYADAIRFTQEAADLTDRALESLNGEQQYARQTKKACSVLTDLWLLEGNAKEAGRQAQQCERRWPHIPVEAPPDTLELLHQQNDELRSQGSVKLHVSSAPSRCEIYVEGFSVGLTPRALTLPKGAPKRLQVGCEGKPPGRVHVASGEADSSVHVDTTLESAVRTSGNQLTLQYRRVDETTLLKHARSIANSLRRTNALVLTQDSAKGFSLQLVTEGHVASTHLPASYERTDLSAAWHGLVRAVQAASTSAAVATHDAPKRTHPQRVKLWTGLSLAVVGGTLTGLGWWRQRVRESDGARFRGLLIDPNADSLPLNYLLLADQWKEERVAPYTLVALGTAFASPGFTLALLPQARQRPWISALSATLGVAGLAGSVVLMVQGEACSPGSADDSARPSCMVDQERFDRGALLLMTSTPFITLPLVHLFSYSPQVSASVGPRHGYIAVQGRF